jgi:hypothetical protein
MRILRRGGYLSERPPLKSLPLQRPETPPRRRSGCHDGRMSGVAVLSRVDAQTQRERVLRLAAAGLILALWAAWALLTWQNAIRTVDVDQFHQDLASGEVLTYRLTANTRHDRPWPPSGIGSTDFDTIALDDSGVPEDGQVADGLVYWMGSGVGRERIVPYDAFVTPYLDPPRQAIEAGVRPVVLPPDQAPTPDAGAPYGWAASALMVGALIAQKPRRATRWFWFFFLQAPAGTRCRDVCRVRACPAPVRSRYGRRSATTPQAGVAGPCRLRLRRFGHHPRRVRHGGAEELPRRSAGPLSDGSQLCEPTGGPTRSAIIVSAAIATTAAPSAASGRASIRA